MFLSQSSWVSFLCVSLVDVFAQAAGVHYKNISPPTRTSNFGRNYKLNLDSTLALWTRSQRSNSKLRDAHFKRTACARSATIEGQGKARWKKINFYAASSHVRCVWNLRTPVSLCVALCARVHNSMYNVDKSGIWCNPLLLLPALLELLHYSFLECNCCKKIMSAWSSTEWMKKHNTNAGGLCLCWHCEQKRKTQHIIFSVSLVHLRDLVAYNAELLNVW